MSHKCSLLIQVRLHVRPEGIWSSCRIAALWMRKRRNHPLSRFPKGGLVGWTRPCGSSNLTHGQFVHQSNASPWSQLLGPGGNTTRHGLLTQSYVSLLGPTLLHETPGVQHKRNKETPHACKADLQRRIATVKERSGRVSHSSL